MCARVVYLYGLRMYKYTIFSGCLHVGKSVFVHAVFCAFIPVHLYLCLYICSIHLLNHVYVNMLMYIILFYIYVKRIAPNMMWSYSMTRAPVNLK